MEKIIIFHENEFTSALVGRKGYYYGYQETLQAIERGDLEINTTQIALLSTDLFERGYQIFMKKDYASPYEIKLGKDNERTTREIRMSHNLLNLWESGEFNTM